MRLLTKFLISQRKARSRMTTGERELADKKADAILNRQKMRLNG